LLSTIDLLSLALMPGNQECMNLSRLQVLIVPIELIPEQPISPVVDATDRHRVLVLLLEHEIKLRSIHLELERLATEIEDEATPTRTVAFRN